MSPKTWTPIAHFIDRILKPFNLVMWTNYECDEDENGCPINARVSGIRIGKRPDFDRSNWRIR